MSGGRLMLTLTPHEFVDKWKQVTARATHFSRLTDHLRKYGNGSQDIAHLLIRLLFCLFAEDIGLFPTAESWFEPAHP